VKNSDTSAGAVHGARPHDPDRDDHREETGGERGHRGDVTTLVRGIARSENP
jgi:hypothetical protein